MEVIFRLLNLKMTALRLNQAPSSSHVWANISGYMESMSTNYLNFSPCKWRIINIWGYCRYQTNIQIWWR